MLPKRYPALLKFISDAYIFIKLLGIKEDLEKLC